MSYLHTDTNTRTFFRSLIDNYKHKTIHNFSKYVYLTLIFGINTNGVLILKHVCVDDNFNHTNVVTDREINSVQLRGDILRFLWINKSSLLVNNREYIHISYLPDESEDERELEDISITKFEEPQTQEILSLCLERDKRVKIQKNIKR